MPRIASIATMPSRIAVFEKALNSMLPQVERVYVYLDHFPSVPDFLVGHPKLTVFRAEEHGNLHASSRFLALRELRQPSVFVSFDDDILYPPDYVAELVNNLAQVRGRALVGVHARVFLPPHQSYIDNAHYMHFTQELKQPYNVHELGAGTCGFISSLLDFDVTYWHTIGMDDIQIAIEAQKRMIPRIAIPRRAEWLTALEQDQPDSIWKKAKRDDRIQSNMMRLLLKLY